MLLARFYLRAVICPVGVVSAIAPLCLLAMATLPVVLMAAGVDGAWVVLAALYVVRMGRAVRVDNRVCWRTANLLPAGGAIGGGVRAGGCCGARLRWLGPGVGCCLVCICVVSWWCCRRC